VWSVMSAALGRSCFLDDGVFWLALLALMDS
jgi:hypothetical protein